MKYLLILILLLTGCGGLAKQKIVSACAAINSKSERLNCYRNEITDMITAQINSDYRDYVRNDAARGRLDSSNVLRYVSLEVNILPSGKVQSVTFTDSSRNARFDSLVEQSVRFAGPFSLPKDPDLKRHLLVFPYSIGFR